MQETGEAQLHGLQNPGVHYINISVTRAHKFLVFLWPSPGTDYAVQSVHGNLGIFNSTFSTEIRRLFSALCFPHTPSPGSHPSPEATVAPLQGHSTGAPVALVLFSMAPLPGFPFPPGALLHPAEHSLIPILSPGLLSVLKAFLLQTQIVTWNKFISVMPMKMERGDIPKGVMENSPGRKDDTG